MNRLSLIALTGLGLALSACGASSPAAPGSGRPPLPTGVEVRFPAAPAGAYLSLLTADGAGVYQLSVPAGRTSVEVDPGRWAAQSSRAVPVAQLIPDGASNVSVPAGAKAVFLHWVMWQDRNANGTRDDGETLDLMTHDRVAYASQDLSVNFTTATPDMRQTWTLTAGWSRAGHYVYLPRETPTYLRSLESEPLGRYTLHVETPVTSQ